MAKSSLVYDVCVMGSGPAGGILAKELAESGAKVALVEAGKSVTPDQFHSHSWPYEFPDRNVPATGYFREVTEAIRIEDSDPVGGDRIRDRKRAGEGKRVD